MTCHDLHGNEPYFYNNILLTLPVNHYSLILTIYTILSDSDLTPAGPQINQTRIILFYEANEPALLHCIALGSPTPRILWYKLDNDRQYSVPEYGNLRIKKLSNGTLSFAPIRRHDWGRYKISEQLKKILLLVNY